MRNNIECPIDGHVCDFTGCTQPEPDPACQPEAARIASEISKARGWDQESQIDNAVKIATLIPELANKFGIQIRAFSAYIFSLLRQEGSGKSWD